MATVKTLGMKFVDFVTTALLANVRMDGMHRLGVTMGEGDGLCFARRKQLRRPA